MAELVASLKRLGLAACIPAYHYALRQATRRAMGIDHIVTTAFSFRLRSLSVRPTQIPSEIAQLLDVIDQSGVRRMLEIGTANGGTAFLFSKAAPVDAELLTLDLPVRLVGGWYEWWKMASLRSVAIGRRRVRLLRGDSHDPRTRAAIETLTKGQPFDFLFIDGDHSYEGAKLDFEMYRDLVKPGGLIGFHDIVPGPARKVGGVPDFWAEVRPKYKHREIVDDWKQGGYGIGLIWMPSRG